jgi:hypothetical protein
MAQLQAYAHMFISNTFDINKKEHLHMYDTETQWDW